MTGPNKSGVDYVNDLALTTTQIRQLADTMRPLAEAHTLPAWCYNSFGFYQAEVREIFMKGWIGITRLEDIPQPGDYVCAEIAEEPIVVLRDKDGAVRAFSSTCRHRGACVVEGRGNARFFRCPFHGWTYDLKGNLIAARQMEQTSDFEPANWSLPALKVEIWEGYIFINFDPDATPLAPRLGPIEERIKNYRLSELRATGAMSFWNQCNWKLSTEQAMDMYHVPDTHFMPQSANWTARSFVEQDPDGCWTMLYTASRDKVHPYVTGTNQVETPFPAIEGLSEAELGSFVLFIIYPCTIIGMLPQGALTFQMWPQGHHRTNVILNLLVSQTGVELESYDEALRETQEGFIVTNNQDMHSAKLTHKGMQSRVLTPGRFSHLERATWELDRYVINKVAAAQLNGD